jgi:hypothetical protein
MSRQKLVVVIRNHLHSVLNLEIYTERYPDVGILGIASPPTVTLPTL